MRGRGYTSTNDWAAFQRNVRGIVLAGRSDLTDSMAESALRTPLAPVALSPLIGFPLRWLRDSGVAHVAICASGRGVAGVREHVGNGALLGMKVSYSEDRSPRGAAGCVRDAAELMRGGVLTPGDTFIVVEGALIPSVDVAELLHAHWEAGAAVTVVVEFDRRRNAVTGPRPNVPGGIYVFDARAIAAVNRTGYQDIKQGLIEQLYRAGERVILHRVHGLSPRVIDYHSYLTVNRWVVERTVEQDLSGYIRYEDALCHHSAQIHPGASFVGPVIVGPNVAIGDDVVVVGPTAIGAHCLLASGTVITRSVLWDSCVVGANAVVDASVVVSRAAIAADRYLCGTVELPAAVDQAAPAVGGDVSPLWSLPALPHTPLRSSPYAPVPAIADPEPEFLHA